MSEDKQDNGDGWNLPWYECMVAIDNKRRMSHDIQPPGPNYVLEESGIDAIEDGEPRKPGEQDPETVLISREHAEVIQEQMKEYYALLDAFDEVKSRNARLEKQLETTRRQSQDIEQEKVKEVEKSDLGPPEGGNLRHQELEKQIEGLKAVVANLRTEYERKLSENEKSGNKEIRKVRGGHRASVDSSVAHSTRSSGSRNHHPHHHRDSVPRFLSRMMNDLRFETNESGATIPRLPSSNDSRASSHSSRKKH